MASTLTNKIMCIENVLFDLPGKITFKMEDEKKQRTEYKKNFRNNSRKLIINLWKYEEVLFFNFPYFFN
jgi:hypothetical protein